METSPAPAQSDKTLNGFLFAKLYAIGSKSEGPMYFLQKFDETEIRIKKHAQLFQDDPALRAHLGTKVSLTGTVDGNEITYISIERCPRSVKGCEIQW